MYSKIFDCFTTNKKINQIRKSDVDCCYMNESPFRVLRAAENGDVAVLSEIYENDSNCLKISNKYGRTVSHIAAYCNHRHILEFIRQYQGDFNVQDKNGETPLHRSIQNDAYDALDFLISMSGIDTSIKNNKKQTALHLATDLNKIQCLEIMSRFSSKFDPDLAGDHERTALHLAAIRDFDTCAKILLQNFNASLKIHCNNGLYPIHEAARNASSKTMEVFLRWAEINGDKREEILSFYDSEGNVPLHSAINSGDIKAVDLCIKSGARISRQQFDFSTPVHFACAQGSLEIIKHMFESQPNEITYCLSCFDAQKMTPLHYAAMFDHTNVVKYLLEFGADINCLDNENRTPLLLAASRLAWNSANLLINERCDVFLKDIYLRNIIHYSILYGIDLRLFLNVFLTMQSETALTKLIQEKDHLGNTPLHYSCKQELVETVELLVKHGAKINSKNYKNETPVHNAAEYGKYLILLKLFALENDYLVINESNDNGSTPLHLASEQGHFKVVQLLLNKGVLIHRDDMGRSPLHLSSMNGHLAVTNILLSIHSHLLDHSDKDGNTALHLSAIHDHDDIVNLLLDKNCLLLYNLMNISAIEYAFCYKNEASAFVMVTHKTRSEEIMNLKLNKYKNVSEALIAYMPQIFEKILDNGVVFLSDDEHNYRSYAIKYDFKCFQTVDHNNVNENKPLSVLNAIIDNKCISLLNHPLTQKYLENKWNSCGKYYQIANLSFYCIFVLITTIFYVMFVNYSMNMQLDNIDELMDLFYYKYALFIIFLIFISMMKELYKFATGKMAYIKEFVNIVTWILYSSLLISLIGILFSEISINIQVISSLGIFLTWFNLLLILQKFDKIGIYIVMFLEISQTLLKAFLVFLILIVAFCLTFFLLLANRDSPKFDTITKSFLQTFTMLNGGYDVFNLFLHEGLLNMTDDYFIFIMIILFIIFVPILLIHLLIGLAVGDIQSVKRNAQLKRTEMQVTLYSNLERFGPEFLMNKARRTELIEYISNDRVKYPFLSNSHSDLLKKVNNNKLKQRNEKISKIFQLLDKQNSILKDISTKLHANDLNRYENCNYT